MNLLHLAAAETNDKVGWGGFAGIVIILYVAFCLSGKDGDDD